MILEAMKRCCWGLLPWRTQCLPVLAAALWTNHHVHTKAILPLGCSQPITEHSVDTNAGLFLRYWDSSDQWWWLRDSPLVWLNLSWNLAAFQDPSYSICFPFPLLHKCHTCIVLWKLCLPILVLFLSLFSQAFFSGTVNLTYRILFGGPKQIQSSVLYI